MENGERMRDWAFNVVVTLVVMIVFSILVGCASTGDIRSSAPIKTANSQQSPKKIANCVLHDAQDEVGKLWFPYWQAPTMSEVNGAYKLFFVSGRPVGELTVKPDEKGGSIIELRAIGVFWGKDLLWDYAMRCAGIKTEGDDH